MVVLFGADRSRQQLGEFVAILVHVARWLRQEGSRVNYHLGVITLGGAPLQPGFGHKSD